MQQYCTPTGGSSSESKGLYILLHNNNLPPKQSVEQWANGVDEGYVLGWEEEASGTSFALADGRYLATPQLFVPSAQVQRNRSLVHLAENGHRSRYMLRARWPASD